MEDREVMSTLLVERDSANKNVMILLWELQLETF